jgi:hypothetical protein
MRHVKYHLLTVALSLAAVGSAAAQQPVSFSRWAAPWPADVSTASPGVTLPDSVRRKVGYRHWRGAAIGGGIGAVLGTVLAFGVAGECADCTVTTWDRAEAALLVTGASSVVGFLVGLASPKYVWETPREATDSEP